MRAADAHRPDEERARARLGVEVGELPDGPRLGDGDVVEHAERADDEPGEQQPAQVDLGGDAGDVLAALVDERR